MPKADCYAIAHKHKGRWKLVGESVHSADGKMRVFMTSNNPTELKKRWPDSRFVVVPLRFERPAQYRAEKGFRK